MRMKKLFATALAAVALVLIPSLAQATGDHRKPDGWGKTRHIEHHVYYPHYVHHYKVDPYAYRYSPRGYYPYYNSGYWAPSSYIKRRNRAHYHHWNSKPPRYHKSWGGPRHWDHRKWHHKNHGYHHRWHW